MQTDRLMTDNTFRANQAFLSPVDSAEMKALCLTEFVSIGRDPTCQLCLNDKFVSLRHARIENRNGSYVLRDLQSRNGSFVNGSRVNEAVLSPQDQVRFGESVFIFSETEAAPLHLKSKNPDWQTQLQRLPAFSKTDFSVLISGPSGSGKEVIARWIHQNSLRSKGPFVSINCSALSESLIESELFGHVKGSFTGATHDRKGAFESARGGTLFLDEIGDLSIQLQPKLLRALENQEIRPVGSDRIIETDVRVIAATHKNLRSQINGKLFREDLFYRLNICNVDVPPLRKRMEDFEDLLYTFAKQYKARFSINAINYLKEQTWVGNIRELKNTVARAAAYLPGKYLQAEDMNGLMKDMAPVEIPLPPVVEFSPPGTGGNLIKEFERDMIMQRLIANRGNQRRTALDLGIPKSTLHDRLKAYQIDLVKMGVKKTSASEDFAKV